MMVTAPLRAPGAVGVKVTLMVQLAPAAIVAPQVLLWAKSPLGAMLEMSKGAVPLLVSVIAWALLVLPTGWAKLRVVGESATAGANVVAVATFE